MNKKFAPVRFFQMTLAILLLVFMGFFTTMPSSATSAQPRPMLRAAVGEGQFGDQAIGKQEVGNPQGKQDQGQDGQRTGKFGWHDYLFEMTRDCVSRVSTGSTSGP